MQKKLIRLWRKNRLKNDIMKRKEGKTIRKVTEILYVEVNQMEENM